MIDDNKKTISKALKKNIFFIALGTCFLVAGIIGISTNGFRTPEAAGEEPVTRENVTYYVEMPDEADNGKTEISIDDFTEIYSEEPTEQQVFDNNVEPIDNNTDAAAEVIFRMPLSNGIAADYSMGLPVFSQTMNDYRTHNGVDFMGLKGESVYAIGQGVVVSVKKDNLWGNCVTIDHGNGIVSTISGLADEALISEGCNVYDETIIGVMGNIPVEGKEPDHVHLEVRKDGEITDPLEILGIAENHNE